MRAAGEKSTLYRAAKCLDKTVNIIALIMLALLLLYAGHSLWYSHSLKNDSFLPEELAKYRPDGQNPSLSDLKRINPDVVAWVTIDGTNIDYPVVQGEDDNEYLNKSVLGEFSLAGALFLSAQNKRDFSDPYNMIHGHHVDGGAMLTDVLEFQDASFFRKHTTGILWYPDDDGRARADRIEIFASLKMDGNDEIVYADPSSVNREILPEVKDYILAMSTNKRDPRLSENSRILGFSTCEDAVSFERILLFGKLVPMTDKEIRAAQDKMAGTEYSNREKQGLLDRIQDLPQWLLVSIGTLLLILLIYIVYRVYTNRR